MAVVAHVDLCTNRSGSDNSTHQSRPHNPFLKDRTNGRQQSGRTAQHRTTKPTTQNNKRQEWKKKSKNTQNVQGDKKKSVCQYEAGGKTCTPWQRRARSCRCKRTHRGRRGENKGQTLTIIAAPVYVDAASVVAGKLGEGETCGVGCGQN